MRSPGLPARLRPLGSAITVVPRLRAAAGNLDASQTWRGSGVRLGAGGVDLGRRAAFAAGRFGWTRTISWHRPVRRSLRAASGEVRRPLLRPAPGSLAGSRLGFGASGTDAATEQGDKPNQLASFKINASIGFPNSRDHATRGPQKGGPARLHCTMSDIRYRTVNACRKTTCKSAL
jgi:hypothetical protein